VAEEQAGVLHLPTLSWPAVLEAAWLGASRLLVEQLAVERATTARREVFSTAGVEVVAVVVRSAPRLVRAARAATPEGEVAVEVVVRMVALAVHLAPVELERATW